MFRIIQGCSRSSNRCWPIFGVVATVALMLAVLVSGCGQSKTGGTHSVFWRFGDVSGELEIIRQSPNADQRRQAICRIVKKNATDGQDVVESLERTALTDTSPAVRCVAVRALQDSRSDSSIGVFLQILSEDPSLGHASGDGSVRLAAAEALTAMAARDQLSANYGAQTVECGIRLLGTDPSRNVRAQAARLLRYFANENVLYALADSLDQRDFGVCYEAERSLMALTGHTHNYDSQLWRDFLASSDDPFEDRGVMDDVLNPAPKSWWSRQKNAVAQALSGFKSKNEDQAEVASE